MYLKLNNSIESIKTQYQYKNINLSPLHNSNLNDKKSNVIDENNNKENNLNNQKENEVVNNINKNNKVGVAWVFKNVFGNGIGRMLSSACSGLAKLENFDIYLITGQGYKLDFKFDERVKIVRIAGNRTLIEQFDKTSNIKIYILHNDLTPSSIKWYQTLNRGKKIIGVTHEE